MKYFNALATTFFLLLSSALFCAGVKIALPLLLRRLKASMSRKISNIRGRVTILTNARWDLEWTDRGLQNLYIRFHYVNARILHESTIKLLGALVFDGFWRELYYLYNDIADLDAVTWALKDKHRYMMWVQAHTVQQQTSATLAAPVPEVAEPDTEDAASEHNVDVPVATPEHDVAIPDDNSAIPDRNVATPTRDIAAPIHNIHVPVHNIAAPAHNIAAPAHNVPIPYDDTIEPAHDIAEPDHLTAAPYALE